LYNTKIPQIIKRKGRCGNISRGAQRISTTNSGNFIMILESGHTNTNPDISALPANPSKLNLHSGKNQPDGSA